MEANNQYDSSYNSEVIQFMKSHRELTVRQCLDLFKTNKIESIDQHFGSIVNHVKQNSDAALTRIEEKQKWLNTYLL